MSSNLLLSVFAKETYFEGKYAYYSRKTDLGVACLYCVEQLVVVYLQLCGVKQRGLKKGGEGWGRRRGGRRGGRKFPTMSKKTNFTSEEVNETYIEG